MSTNLGTIDTLGPASHSLHFTLMPTTHSTKCKAALVTNLQSGAINMPTVNNQVFCVKLCKEQSVIFRQNIEEYKKKYALYTQSVDATKSGQNWDLQPATCLSLR